MITEHSPTSGILHAEAYLKTLAQFARFQHLAVKKGEGYSLTITSDNVQTNQFALSGESMRGTALFSYPLDNTRESPQLEIVRRPNIIKDSQFTPEGTMLIPTSRFVLGLRQYGQFLYPCYIDYFRYMEEFDPIRKKKLENTLFFSQIFAREVPNVLNTLDSKAVLTVIEQHLEFLNQARITTITSMDSSHPYSAVRSF